MLLGNEGFPAFDCNDNAYVKLGICISHDVVLSKAYPPVAPLGLGVGWFDVFLYTYRPAGAKT